VPEDLMKFSGFPGFLEKALYIIANPPENLPNNKSEPKEVGRVLTIPGNALKQWHLDPSPLWRLMGEPKFIYEDSPYWNHLRAKYPEGSEEFYQAAFPHDIPDEWSVEERAKSHGPRTDITCQSVTPDLQEIFFECFLSNSLAWRMREY